MAKKSENLTEQEIINKLLSEHDSTKNSKRFNLTLRRTAGEVKSYSRYSKAFKILALILLLLIVLIFVIALMYTRYSSFTVSVTKLNNLNYSLQISETADFSNPTNRLECPSVMDITNIDGRDLDMNRIGSVDGEDNGKNYLCYTFYLRNGGKQGININYNMTISNVEKNLDEACRIRVIYSRDESEREVTDYAKATGVDPVTHKSIPEEGTTMFEDRYLVCTNDIKALMPGEICKFTVVIWIEGPDPQCTDDKIGGLFETDMVFEVVGVIED